MSVFSRVFAATVAVAALTGAAPLSAPAASPTVQSASFQADALAAQRVLLRRRDCSRWYTCGPFKREKPRLA
jgi:hypothetical protein